MKDLYSYITENVGEVKNKKFLRLMKSAGLEKIKLVNGNGYFYITSDDDATWKTINDLPNTDIYVNSFNDMKPEEWVEEIRKLIKNNI